MEWRTRWTHYIDRQHQHPSGLVGRLIGQRMLRQHRAETDWSIDLLNCRPTHSVLELGAGAGRSLALLLERTPRGRVVGADLSATMLRAAARRNGNALRSRRLSLLRADLERLPLAGSHFNAILSIHTLYFWSSPAITLRRLRGLLAPNGRLVITFADARRCAGGWQHWPIRQSAERQVADLRQEGWRAHLMQGPIARGYSHVALVVDRHTVDGQNVDGQNVDGQNVDGQNDGC